MKLSSAFRPVLVYVLALSAVSLVGEGTSACDAATTKTAADVALKVSDEFCKEEEAQGDAEPDWVQVACKVEAPASGVAHVLLPRTNWEAIKARKAPPPPCPPCGDGGASPKPTFPAGPGK